MPKRHGPATRPAKIPSDLLKRVAALAEERGCFQQRILMEAVSEYLAKAERAKPHPD